MSEQQIAKLKARVKKLEAERSQRLFDDARYAALLRRFIKEKQWGGVFMVMANYFGAGDHIGCPPGMEELKAQNARLQDEMAMIYAIQPLLREAVASAMLTAKEGKPSV